MELEKPILIYDAECSLCERFKKALDFIDKEGRIQKVPLQEEWLYEKFTELDKEECLDVSHLIDEKGQILKGPEVVEYLVSFYPGVKHFSWLIESESGKKAVDFFYDKVSQIRKNLKDDCPDCRSKGRRSARKG